MLAVLCDAYDEEVVGQDKKGNDDVRVVLHFHPALAPFKAAILPLSKGWVYGWQKKGWVKSDKKPALNVDLWERLLPLIAAHDVRYHWVKGHAENEYNNRCDELAVAESRKYK